MSNLKAGAWYALPATSALECTGAYNLTRGSKQKQQAAMALQRVTYVSQAAACMNASPAP